MTIILFDGELDLAMREADVAIRMMPPRQPDLIQRHLLTLRHTILAAPSYLERFGTPTSPEDLDNHRIITYSDDGRSTPPMVEINWLLQAGANPNRPRRPVLEINNVYAICRAVKAGVGIAALPSFMAPETRDLVQVLPDLKGPKLDAYFVYPEELRHSKRITVFRDFLLQSIAEDSDGCFA